MAEPKNYLITAAQHEAPLHRPFLRSLESYAREHNAEIIFLTMRERKNDDGFPRTLDDRIILEDGQRFKLNNKFYADNYHIRPQQIDPITGLARFTQSDVSTVFASPKQRLKIVPNSVNDLPKALITTGAVTRPGYRQGFRITDIAQRDHKLGALLVEIVGVNKYHYRHLTANSSGVFADNGNRYLPNGDIIPSALEALVLGDLHVGDHNPKVLKATYEMIDRLQPKRIILHDLFNGHSVNHHEQGKLVNVVQRYREGRASLDEELYEVAEFLEELVERSNGAEIVIVDCNHHDFLLRYLNEKEFTRHPENTYLASKILPAVIDGANPVEVGISVFYDIPDNVKFLSRSDDYKVLGWQLGVHGDKGPNGAWRAGIAALESSYGKSITGHKHTPEILRDTFVVGTSTFLDLKYLRGPSSWMNTHAFLYDTGRPQLINIIDGKWRK